MAHDAVALLFSQPHESVVGDNANEPGPELCVGAEFCEMAIGVEVAVLNGVLSSRVVPKNRAGHSKEPRVMPPHQRLERTRVALKDPLDEFHIVANGRCCGVTGWHQCSCR